MASFGITQSFRIPKLEDIRSISVAGRIHRHVEEIFSVRHVSLAYWIVSCRQSFQFGIFCPRSEHILQEIRVGVCFGHACSGAEVSCVDITLPVCARDDSVFSELHTPSENCVLQFRPHLCKSECRCPPESGMPRWIRTVGPQKVGIIFSPRIFIQPHDRPLSAICFFWSHSALISSVVRFHQQSRQGWGLFVADGVDLQHLRHHGPHDFRQPWSFTAGLLSTWRIPL